MIREALGDGSRFGVRLSYVDEPERLGTIGALTLIRPRPAEPFFVINADILTKCDFRAMWEFHRAEGARMTVGVSLHQVDIPYGEFTLHGTRISRVEEKPRKEFPVNAGIYLLDPSLIDLIPPGQYFDATDLIRACLERDLPVSALSHPRVLARRGPPRRPAQGRPRRRRRAPGLAACRPSASWAWATWGSPWRWRSPARASPCTGWTPRPAVLAALGEGRAHLFEPGVEEGLAAFRGDRLRVAAALPPEGVDAVMICVSTPTNPGHARARAGEPARGGPRTWPSARGPTPW